MNTKLRKPHTVFTELTIIPYRLSGMRERLGAPSDGVFGQTLSQPVINVTICIYCAVLCCHLLPKGESGISPIFQCISSTFITRKSVTFL